MGSTFEVQSPCFGGTSIHSSRWGFLAASLVAKSSSRVCWRFLSASCFVEPGAGGKEGPKSLSEELSSASDSGAVGGTSKRSAGGGAGPMTRRGSVSLELLKELRRRFGGVDAVSCASSSRLRFVWR